MVWQNLVFAVVTPIILAALIALIISGLGMSLLWIAGHAENTQLGRAFGALLNLHGHEIGKGLAVLVALIYATVLLIGSSVASRMAGPGPGHAEHPGHPDHT
jgi:hypothetical protein